MNNKKLKTKTEKTGTWKKEYRKNQSKKGRPEAWLWFLHFFSEAYVVVFYFFRGNICCTSGGSTMFLAQSQIMLLTSQEAQVMLLAEGNLHFHEKHNYVFHRSTFFLKKPGCVSQKKMKNNSPKSMKIMENRKAKKNQSRIRKCVKKRA